MKKMAIESYISVITLNMNWLNASTKRHRSAEWIQKPDPYICCLQEIPFRPKDTYKLKIRGWKNIFHANGKQKKGGVAILISDKLDFKIKNITRDKEGCYITIKGSNQEGDTKIVNIYAPNIGASQYIRQKGDVTDVKGDIAGETDSSTIIGRDINTPFTPMDRSSRQKTNKETHVLNDTLMRWISLTSSGHSIQMQKNIPSQEHMEHSPG